MRQEIKDRIEKIRNGEVPEGYKTYKSGICPKQWELKTLADVNSISTGATPLRSRKEFFEGDIPWVKTTDLNNSYIFETEEKISELTLSETSVKMIDENSILVAMYGGFNQIGRTGLMKIKGTSNQAISSFFVDEKSYNAEYVLHWLNAKRRYWKVLAGSSRKDPNITKKDVEDFPIARPNYDEQQKIARVLSTWDKAIELKEQLIEQKKEQKRGLMKKLLTGEVRLPGFNGEWKEVKISQIIKESKEIEKNPDLDRLISVKLHLQGVLKRELVGNEVVGATTMYKRKKGQFIYGKQNFHNGALGLIPDELDGFASSTDIPAFDFLGNHSAKFFFYYWAREEYYKGLENLTTGTGSKRLNPKEFLKLSIKIPDYNEQHEIVKVLQAMDDVLDILEQELEALKLQKKGLMQLLLTGIVRVPN